MTPSHQLTMCLRHVQLTGFACGLIGGLICLNGYLTDPNHFFSAYLTAYLYWMAIANGCLIVALIHGLTGGGWGRSIRRVIESGFETIPILALLFVPIWLGVSSIYLWSNLDFVQQHHSMIRKAGYLNVAGYQCRSIAYFATWILISFIVNKSSPNEERSTDSPRIQHLQLTSGQSLIAYGFTFTLAAVDWAMSLEPLWYSTMYGLIHIAGQAVSGLAFSIVVVSALKQFEPWSHIVTAARLNDLGNLLLAAVMFWAYCSFFQFLVIWCGNLPEENVWYLLRSQHGWQYLACSLVAFHFVVPFFLLLSRRFKRERTELASVAGLLLLMRYVDLYWLVVPAFQQGRADQSGPKFHLLDLAALAAIGGVWLSLFAWRLSVRIQIPMFDPESWEMIDERSRQTAVV